MIKVALLSSEWVPVFLILSSSSIVDLIFVILNAFSFNFLSVITSIGHIARGNTLTIEGDLILVARVSILVFPATFGPRGFSWLGSFIPPKVVAFVGEVFIKSSCLFIDNCGIPGYISLLKVLGKGANNQTEKTGFHFLKL